ncbi:MAG: metallophosphoesterase family protein [Gaiellaceae bacterium]
MPLALVSDIHGNDPAFAAVAAELERLGVERAVCLGDVAQGGDEPAEVLDRLAALGWPAVLGNSDVFLLDPAEEAPRATPAQLAKREWSLARLAERHREQIRSWPLTIDLELDGGVAVRAFHGSPHSYDDVLAPDSPDAHAERLWGGSGVDVLAGGHSHQQWTRVVDGALYVNPGSIGASDDGLAQFAVVTGAGVSFKRVAWNAS